MSKEVKDDAQVIIKTQYFYPVTRENQQGFKKRVADDALLYTIGHADGSRERKIISSPKIEFFKSLNQNRYPHLSMPKDEVRRIACNYNDRTKVAAEETGQMNDLWDAFKTKSHRKFIQENLNSHPDLYALDVDIEDFCKTSFVRKNGNHYGKVPFKKSFMDIEVDTYHERHFDQKDALCPINIISYLDRTSNTIHEFILRYPEEIPVIKEIEDDPVSFVAYVYEHFEKVTKQMGKKLKQPLQYNIALHFYDTELELVKAYFEIMKETKPDFCGIWNMNFDIITILNRLKKLNQSPDMIADLICEDDIPEHYRYVNYKEDYDRSKEKSDTHYSRFFDIFTTATDYQWYDQMSLFSNLRKRFVEPSYKLDEIGQKYANINKVNLADHGTDIACASRDDFRLFLLYAVMDVVVQDQIEYQCEDIDKYMLQSYNTRFSHGNKMSILIKNLMADYYDDIGHVIGNNVVYSDVARESVPGAIIAKPDLIIQKGREILGEPSHCYSNVIDLDYSSLYPTIMICYNILKNTVYGRIMEVYIENMDGSETLISNGDELVEMVETIDTSIFDIGEKYFGLPSYEDIASNIDKALAINNK